MPIKMLQQIPSKGKLQSIFKKLIFGTHIHCLECQSRQIVWIKKEKRWRCKKCGLPFSIKSSCFLKGSKLSLEQIWLLLWCWQKQIPIKQAMSIIGVSYPTVFSYYAKFRDNIPKERINELILKNKVVCDEMYTRGNSIIDAKEKGTKNIVLKVNHTKNVNKQQAVEFLTRFVKANSYLFTDGSGIYRGIGNWHRLKHTYEVHRKFEFSLTAEIEGIWACFRTFVRRMYHHVTTYKLEDLVSEFCLRFRHDKMFESPHEYLRICLCIKPFAL